MNNPRDAAQSLQAMSDDPQNGRLMRLRFPNNDGPKATMLPNRLRADEGLSREFRIEIEALSDNARIPLKEMMGKMITVELVREDGTLRYFNGYVNECQMTKTDGGYAYYQIVLVPWLHFLRLRQNSRMFHGKSLEQQFDIIFGEYDIADWEVRDLGDDPPMTDACQFQETDFNYVNRRAEDRDIGYGIEHAADGHTVIFFGNSTLAEPIDGDSDEIEFHRDGGSQEQDAIGDWTPVRSVMPSKVAVTSFDFKSPKPVHLEVPTKAKQGDVPETEVHEYVGAYGFKNRDDGDHLGVRRMEEMEAAGKDYRAASNCRNIESLRSMKLAGHYDFPAPGTADDEREFLIVDVHHEISNNYLQGAGCSAEYANTFTCLRKKIPWRPGRGRNSTQPRVYGPQTAIVVGPPGEEIYTDQYGRVCVQFHWDREGEYDQRSSAFIRVASTWAGSNFGLMAVPRVGQEVIVNFLDGNPDRPIITGRVFNADNMPPWDLPANQTQTGILSRSSKGGGYENANAIRFEDKKGAEEVWLHAEKDQRIEVEHDESHWVGHDRTKTIDHDETSHIKHDRTETVDNDETITVHNNRTERVDHNETISIGDNRSEDVGQNETISIGSNRSVSIGGNKSETVSQAKTESIGLAKALSVGLGYQVSVGGAMNTTVGLIQAEEVGINKTVMVGNKYSITAGDELEIKVGEASLLMKADGTIVLNGTKVRVAASGPTDIIGTNVNLNPPKA